MHGEGEGRASHRRLSPARRVGAALALVGLAALAAGSHVVGLQAATALPTLILDPSCGPVGQRPLVYQITVVGSNFPNDRNFELWFGTAQNPQQQPLGNVLTVNGGFTRLVTVLQQPAGTYVVSAQLPAGTVALPSAAQARFTVPCPPTPTPRFEPALVLTPTVGPPGTVLAVQGSGFAPGTPVQLSWDRGLLGPDSGAVTADGAGGFRVALLIYPHDLLGRRTLTARTSPVAPPSSPASATFLVVPGSVQPRDFTWRN